MSTPDLDAPPTIAPANIVDGVFAHARADPDCPAIVSDGVAVSYRTLARWVSAVADAVTPRAEHEQPPVGVVAHRSAHDVAAMLGVLAAGRCYLPVDPDAPSAYLRSVLAATGCVEVVATAATGYRPPVPELIEINWTNADLPEREAAEPVVAGDPAYVLFTSGSTGAPKGVVLPHSALAATVPRLRELFGIRPGETALYFHSAASDTSLEEVLPTLTGGGTLVIDDDCDVRMSEVLAEHEISVLNLTTSYWLLLVNRLLDEGAPLPGCVRTVIIGGEACRADMLERWGRLGAGHVRLLNTYGATETGMITHAVRLDGPDVVDGGGVVIGRPLPHVRQRLISEDTGEPVGPGEVGELYLSGPNVALGYHGDPGLTAKWFPRADFGDGPRRWYRTHDLVRARPDGALVFHGRIGHQVKIRGFRVDLNTVEEQIAAVPGVVAVAVAAARRGEHESLVAFVVAAADADTVLGRVRARLVDSVPAHLVPNELVAVPELRYTASGKIDRNATRDEHLRGSP
ncbi:amino acid adenylation domain-containing protein [Saccharopolyspora gregorii]|uniref:Amino acid adenylation domain-containing protein n=1 Tax=Saccharopolyspora gregorii TaxID=33914 RepID=A0ABP6RU93_9PSEU